MTPSHLESAQKILPREFEDCPGSFGLEETQSAFLTRAISRGAPKLPVTGNFLHYHIMARDGPPLGQNGRAVGSPAGLKSDHALHRVAKGQPQPRKVPVSPGTAG